MKIFPFLRRKILPSCFLALGALSVASAQEITYFGETDSPSPGSIADREIGADPFTLEVAGFGGTITISVSSIEPLMRGADLVVPATLIGSTVNVSTDQHDSGRVTLQATLRDDEDGTVLDTVTRTFTVRRDQTISFVDLPDVDLGDPSFEVNLAANPDEGQSLSFRIVDGPAEIDADTGRVNVFGTGAILFQAFAGGTNYDPLDPGADLVAATFQNKTLVVGGKEPVGGPGFLDLWTWRNPQLSLTEYLLDIAVNDSGTQFVAVGADGQIVQGSDPTDRTTWTEPDAGTTEHLFGVVRGATRYVAVGMNEAVTTSTDGLSWSTGGVSGIDPGTSLRAVGFDPDSSEYVAVGTNAVGRAVLYSSPDGLAWSADVTFPAFLATPLAVSYSPVLGTWQVVGETGIWVYGTPASWEIKSFGFGDDFNDVLVTEAGVTFVVGDSGTILRADAGSGQQWTTVNSGANYDLETIAFNGRYLIASGENGRLLRSNLDNGDRWVEAITPFRFDVQAIAFIDGLLIGVGQNDSVATSGSGFDWTLRDSTTPGSIHAVASDGSVTVAVGDDGQVYLSTDDGETWADPAPGIPEDLRDVIHGPVGFLAVGTGGAIYSSADGSSWTPATSVEDVFGGSFTGNLNAVHYNGGTYAAVGENLAILASPDGQNWTQRTAGGVTLNDLTSKDGKFLAVGAGGQIASSSDGLFWSLKASGVAENLHSVAASDSEYIAVGENGALLSSPNGATWTPRISTVTEDLYEVLHFNETFYAFGGGFALLTSDSDGNWTSQVAATQNRIFGAAVAGDTFVAVTDFGGILTSPTAGSTGLEEWTFRYTGAPGADINDVTYGSQGFVAVGDSGQILISEDGQNWEERSVSETNGEPLTEDLLGVAFGNGLYLAVGAQKLISSTDARNWTVVTTWTVPVNSVTFGNGLFVATGDVSTILYSTNGTTWQGGSVNGIHEPAPLRDSVYDEDSGGWVAVGDPALFRLPNGDEKEMTQLFVSNDGQTWTRQPSPEIAEDEFFAQPLFTLAAGDGKVRAFGEGRLIYFPADDSWVISALGDFPTFASIYTKGNGFGGFVYAGQNGAISGLEPRFISFPGVTENLNGLAFGSESYVAVGDNGRILISSDARDWVIRSTGNLAPLNDIAVDLFGRYVAVGDGGTILRSNDSISWTPAGGVPDLTESGDLNAVTTGADGFAAVGDFGTILLSSEGENWAISPSGIFGHLNGVAAIGTTRVVVGAKGTILLDEGGDNWIEQNAAGVSTDLLDVHYAAGQFTAVGKGGVVLTSSDGQSWNLQTSGVSEDLLSIGYGDLAAGGYWTAAGESGAIYVSADNGTSWTDRDSGSLEDLRDVAFGQSNFLATGTDGTVLSSNNSSDWFSRPVGTDYALNGAAFFNGVFTLVGDFQTIVTSGRIEERVAQEILFLPIGDKIVSDPPFEPQVLATSGLPVTLEIVSGPASLVDGDLVLDGSTGTVVIEANQAGSARYLAAESVQVSFEVRLSSQTINFFGEPGSTAPGSISDQTFGSVPFEVTASSTSSLPPVIAVESGPAVISSQAGGTATVSLTGAGSVTLSANQSGDGSFAAAQEVVRSFQVGRATQTIEFDLPPNAGEADPPLTLSASASSGLPVSFAVTSGQGSIANGDQLIFSESGTVTVQAFQTGDADYLPATPVSASILVEPAETGDVWQTRSAGTSSDLLGVAFAQSRFYAVGTSQTVLSSSNSQNWSLRANGTNELRDVAYGGVPGIFLAVGSDGIPLYSEDGSEWSLLPETGLSGLNGIIYASGRFFAVGDGGAIWRSLNGEIWSPLNSGVATDLQDITYSNGKLIAVGENTVLISESGGASWTPRTFSNEQLGLNAVAGDGSDGLMAVGSAGQILYSGNAGSSWIVRPSPVEAELRAIAYGNDRFVIAGDAGAIYSSGDAGLSWILRQSGTNQSLRDATYRSSVFVIVGDGGTILTSGLSATQIEQTLDFPALSPPTSGLTVPLVATALADGTPSGQEVQFHLVSGSGTISGTALQVDGSTTATLEISGDPGTYKIRASLPVAGDYLAVPGVDREFTVLREAQTVANVFPAAGELSFSTAPIGLSATAVDPNTDEPTGLGVQYEVVSGDASITGNSLTLNSGSVGGQVVIRLFNSGDSTYSPLDETVTYSIVPATAQIVFKAIPNKLLDDPNFFVEANTSDGGDVQIQIIEGADLITLRSFNRNDGDGNLTFVHEVTIGGTPEGQGRVVLEAFLPPDSGITADPVRQSFYISRFAQNISFDDPGSKTFGDPPFAINASADGGGEITFSLADATVASLDGSIVTILSAGTIKISAAAEPNGDFGPAQGELTISVDKANQRLEFDEIDDQFEGSVIAIPLTARTFVGSSEIPASPGIYPITFTVVEGTDIATISGSTLTLNGKPGTVKVQARQNGNANVLAAAPVEQTFTVSNFGRAPVNTDESFSSAAYGDGQFVAVGFQGGAARTIDGSSDPTTWEAVIPTPNNPGLFDVAYGNGRFVAVGYNGVALNSTDGGKSWSAASASTLNPLGGIAFGAGTFVAIETSVLQQLHTSTNGTSWTPRSIPTDKNLTDLVFGRDTLGNPRFVAVGSVGTVLTSSNGISWTRQTQGTLSFALRSVAYGDGLFVAITSGRDYLFSEDGGVTWFQKKIPSAILPDSPSLQSIAFGNSTFRVVGSNGTVLTASPEAIREPVDPSDNSSRWVREISLGSSNLNRVIFGGDRFVAVGQNGTILISLPEVAAVTLSDWIDSFDFSGLTAGPVAGTDDPDGDSYSVALEYALFGDPLHPEPNPLVRMSSAGGEAMLSFTRRLTSDVTIHIQESTDMVDWTTIRSYDPASGSWDDTDGLAESVNGTSVDVDFATSIEPPCLFLRVRVVE